MATPARSLWNLQWAHEISLIDFTLASRGDECSMPRHVVLLLNMLPVANESLCSIRIYWHWKKYYFTSLGDNYCLQRTEDRLFHSCYLFYQIEYYFSFMFCFTRSGFNTIRRWRNVSWWLPGETFGLALPGHPQIVFNRQFYVITPHPGISCTMYQLPFCWSQHWL